MAIERSFKVGFSFAVMTASALLALSLHRAGLAAPPAAAEAKPLAPYVPTHERLALQEQIRDLSWPALLRVLDPAMPGEPGRESGDFNYEKLVKLIGGENPLNRPVVRIDDLLPLLPKSYLRHYSLIKQSRSSQAASPEQPRVVMFGNSGKLLITFNGSGNLGGHALETIEYNEKAHEFEFREIVFPAENAPGESGRAHAIPSKTNPARCFGCHRDQLRPSFESYPFSPGLYGADADSIRHGSSEDTEFRAYLKDAPTMPRYRHLVPYAQLVELERTNEADEYVLPILPNTQLSGHITHWNSDRMAYLISQAPKYSLFKYALLAAVGGCENVETFVPEAIRAGFSRTYREVELESITWRDDYIAFLKKETAQSSGVSVASLRKTPLLDLDHGRIGAVRWLVEQGLGLDMRDWSTSFYPDALAFNGPTAGLAQLEALRAYGFESAMDRGFKENPIRMNLYKEECGWLKARSLQAWRP